MTDTRQALAALLPCPFCGNSKGLAVANENPQDLSGGYFIACPSCDASTGLRFACGEDPIPLLIEQWNRRAALSAQPVAGAVALTDNQLEPVLEAWFVTDGTFYERMRAALSAQPVAGAVEPTMPQWSDGPVKEQTIGEAFKAWRKAQTAPAPEPSVQAVAHPSHQTVREWMPVSEALRLSDLWTAGDLDNCGQWRAAIKVLADEVRALAASPQPEPSAKGEPVALQGGMDNAELREAWDKKLPGVRPSDRELSAFAVGVEVGFDRARDLERQDWSRVHHVLAKHGVHPGRTDDRLDEVIDRALASAPSTPPPAVVEAVPLTNERGGYFSASLLASATMSDEAEGRAYRGYCPKCKHLTLVVKQRGNGLVFKGCAVCDSMVVLREKLPTPFGKASHET